MKLQNELQNVTEKMQAIKGKIAAHAVAVKESGKFKNLETRVAGDALRAVVPTATICEWYTKYECDDTHIATLAKNALKQVYCIDTMTLK